MIKVCTDPSLVGGDGEIKVREKPLPTNCFTKSDSNKNFDLSSFYAPALSWKKPVMLGKGKKKKRNSPGNWSGKDKCFIYLF